MKNRLLTILLAFLPLMTWGQGTIDPEPYVVLTDSDTVMTFYYDGQKTERGGIGINNAWIPGNSFYGTATTAVFDVSFDAYRPTSTASWFQGCSSLVAISGIEYLHTDDVTDMSYMFAGCPGLTSLDLSNFNTANVTDMSYMFAGCNGLASLVVSNFNTTNVTDMSYMFAAFYNQIILDLSNFNTANVTSMEGMFSGSHGLTSVNVTNFNTSNVTNMRDMFNGCSSLESIDFTNFNTANLGNTIYMFYDCSSLKTIYAGEGWNAENISESEGMFLGCIALVGGKGTVYDSNHIDHTYAHIDGGTSNPGYFTLSGDSPYVPVDVTFDNNGVLTVGGTATMAEALETVGGTNVVAETITAIVWNSTTKLSNSDLQDLHNPNMLIYVEVDTLAPVNRDNVIVGDVAQNVVLTDVSEGNGNFYCPKEFKAESISYSHNYNQTTEVGVARGWESIALPFDVQTIMHDKQGLVAPFGNSTSGKHFWLRQATENGLASATIIEANTAYLISMPNSDAYSAEFNLNGHVTFSSQNVWVPKTMINGVDFHTKDNTLVVLLPNFQRQASDDMIYALNVGEQRGNYPEGSVFEREYRAVRPFEAYTIHMGGPAPQFISFFDMNGGMTGIESLTPARSEDEGTWYTIDGRKLQTKPTQKGVYILNGRKAVVK